MDASVVDSNVAEGGAVLRHVDRRRGIVARDAHEQVAKAVRVDLPPHIRVLSFPVARHLRAVCAGADDEAKVVVDAEEVERLRDRLEIAFAQVARDDRVALEQVAGVRTSEDRIEEPAVAFAVDSQRGRFVLRRLGSRIRVRGSA